MLLQHFKPPPDSLAYCTIIRCKWKDKVGFKLERIYSTIPADGKSDSKRPLNFTHLTKEYKQVRKESFEESDKFSKKDFQHIVLQQRFTENYNVNEQFLVYSQKKEKIQANNNSETKEAIESV